MKTIIIVMISIPLLCTTILADDQKEDKTAADMELSNNPEDLNVILEHLSWLAGRWEGEAFGGRCEEIWAPPSAGSMVGLFKVWKNSKVSFYEIETITIDSSGLALSVKHFNADLSGWEEKDDVVRFPFVSAGEEEIRFKGVTYRKTSSESLRITLDTRDKDGNVHQIEINLEKSK